MRNQVFISYRHESPDHSRAVRRLGERLRQAGLPVMLDQFYLEDHPGGPDEGWPKWCEDCANKSACVLIIASEGWFAAYNKDEPPDLGLGAATEADLFRQDLYDQKGHNDRIRLIFLHSIATGSIPVRLRGWHQFRPLDTAGADELIRWLASRLVLQNAETSAVKWPEAIHFQPDIADRNKNEWPAVINLLAGKSSERIVLFEGGSGVGKSELVRQSAAYAKKIGVPVAYIDFKGGTLKTDDVLSQIDLDIGAHLPTFSKEEPRKPYSLRKDLRALGQPVLLIFDSYEDVAGNQNIAEWLNVQLLGDLGSAPAVTVIVAGQRVPDPTHPSWRDLVRHFALSPITEVEHWTEWVSRKYPDFQQKGDLNTILKLAKGQPSVMVTLCEAIAKS
jgi:hypothetical protein